MKERMANCPACGGPVHFRISTSLVTICEFCHSAVARGDREPEDWGKVSDLVDLKSPLSIGVTGKYRDKKFEVIGRVQYRHPSGATWNEWYLLFPGDIWGWLAEAQGRYYVTFERRLKSTVTLPTFDKIELGQSFDFMKEKISVAEKSMARVYSAEGEIPWAAKPGAVHSYADLRGEEGVFATIDYDSNPPTVFVGYSVDVASLELSEGYGQAVPDAVIVGALQLNCPKCGGALSLHAPDDTLRVACPSCNSLLDANQGKLRYLQTLSQKRIQPLIPLGSTGKLFDAEYTVIGLMERYVVYEGKKYSWTEYLLHNSDKGFRWLVNSNHHWSFVQPVDYPAGKVMGMNLTFKGQSFRKYDTGTAYVACVYGEFYWQVSVGETVQTVDYIAPPHMLSFESTYQVRSKTKANDATEASGASEEINVSYGTYLPVEDLEKAFKLKMLPRPWGVGPIQPSPQVGYSFGLLNAIFAGCIFLTYVVCGKIHPTKAPDGAMALIALAVVSAIPICILIYKYSFEVKRWENSDFSPYSSQ